MQSILFRIGSKQVVIGKIGSSKLISQQTKSRTTSLKNNNINFNENGRHQRSSTSRLSTTSKFAFGSCERSFSTFTAHDLTDLYVKLQNSFKTSTSESPSLNFEIGRVQYWRNQNEEARKYLEKTIKLDPKHKDGMFLLAKVYEELREWEKAYKTIQKAAKLDPTNNAVLLKLANLEWIEGDKEMAKEHLETVLKSEPENSSAHLDLANVYSSLGKVDEALKHYRVVARLEPKNEMARFRIAMLLMGEGQMTLNNIDEGVSILKEILKLNPSSSLAHYELATVLRTLSQNSATTTISAPEKSMEMNALIMNHLNKAIEVLPNHIYALLMKAKILSEEGKRELAMETYEQVVNVSYEDYVARSTLATMYEEEAMVELFEKGNPELALEWWHKSIDQYRILINSNPTEPKLHHSLALALVRFHRYGTAPNNEKQQSSLLNEAAKQVMMALKFVETNENVDFYKNTLAQIYRLQGKLAKSLKIFLEIANEHRPNQSSSWFNVGRTIYALSLQETDPSSRLELILPAIENLNNALKLADKTSDKLLPFIHVFLGHCNYALPNFEEAAKHFEMALRSGDVKKLIGIYPHLASCYILVENFEKANETLKNWQTAMGSDSVVLSNYFNQVNQAIQERNEESALKFLSAFMNDHEE